MLALFLKEGIVYSFRFGKIYDGKTNETGRSDLKRPRNVVEGNLKASEFGTFLHIFKYLLINGISK